MNQANLLARAKQGDERAIAALINKTSQKQGVSATVRREGSCLAIVLVSAEIPNQAACIRFIHNGMLKLQAKSIQSIRLYGKKIDGDSSILVWEQTLQLEYPPNPKPQQPSPPASIPTPPTARKKTQKRPLVYFSFLGLLSCFLIAAGGSTFTSQLPTPLPPPPNISTPIEAPASSPLPPVILPTPNPLPTDLPLATPSPALNLDPTPEPVTPTVATSITIKAVGDIVPGTNFPDNRLPKNPDIFFQGIKPQLQGADIVFGNFESTFTNYPKSAKRGNGKTVFAFRSPPAHAKLLKAAGFNVLSVANNHSFDFFEVGFKDTIRNIEAAGMKAVGEKNKITYIEQDQLKLAFIGFSHLYQHNSFNDLDAAKKLVKEAKSKADIVIVSAHIGAEGLSALRTRNQTETFFGENRGNPVLFSRTMIDNGADLILGHGPHVPRALELYKGKLIAYSLGNFLGYATLSNQGDMGSSLILEAQLNQEGDFMRGKIIPVHLKNQAIPQLDNSFRSVQLIRNLTQQDFPKTPLAIDSKGEITKK